MDRKTPAGTSDHHWSLESGKGSALGTTAGAPWSYSDRRIRTDRRLVYDRRELIRFENDRRASKERRHGMDPWGIP